MCQSKAEGGLRCASHINKRINSTYEKFMEEINPIDSESQEFKDTLEKITSSNQNTPVKSELLSKIYPHYDEDVDILDTNMSDDNKKELLLHTPFAMNMDKKVRFLKSQGKSEQAEEIQSMVAHVLSRELQIHEMKKRLFQDSNYLEYKKNVDAFPDKEKEYGKQLMKQDMTIGTLANHLWIAQNMNRMIINKASNGKNNDVKKLKKNLLPKEMFNNMNKQVLEFATKEKIKENHPQPAKADAYNMALAMENPTPATKKFIAAIQTQKANEFINNNETMKDFARLINSKSEDNNTLKQKINKPSLALLANSYKGNGEFKKPLFASKEYKQATEKMSEIIKLYPEGFKVILGK